MYISICRDVQRTWLYCIVNIYFLQFFFGLWSEERKMGKFKRVCVFCGSNSGNRKIFGDAALDLGRELVCTLSLSLSLLYTHTNTNTNRWVSKIHLRVYLQVEKKMDLVYGGGSVGLMGLVSQTVFDGGCHVLG